MTKPFDTHTSVAVQLSESNLENDVVNAIKEYVNPKVKTAILINPPLAMYSIIPIIQDKFKSSSMNLVLSKVELENVKEYLRQQDIIRHYHDEVSLSREAMEKLDDQHYVVSFPQPTKVRLTCGREDINSLQGSYLATIPVNCYLRTPEFTITNDNDEIKGQPLKLMKIPYDEEKRPTTTSHINLHSINLKGLHEIEDRIMMEAPLQLERAQPNALYHTTIPFYIVILSAGALTLYIVLRRYRLWHHKTIEDPASPAPGRHIYEKPGNKKQLQTLENVPATFSLNVLK
ncbi:uncharacterized protein LOC126382136 [Pectinophora gossypiella]|uniref:uncharacterized protein LOC126382136 n=1 Tax=Pectinophora gossypiella TaxID=13191 RepID=UPI00214F615F|nr:uncharacterized protein LOC126382136 [Pectinophora gossypiella]